MQISRAFCPIASELAQEANIVLVQQTHIVDFIAHHGNTFKTDAESKTAVNAGVDAAVFQLDISAAGHDIQSRPELVFSLIAIALESVLGIALAVLINRKFHGRRIVQALMLLPVVATPVALGMAWKLILEPSIGFANVVVTALGFEARKFLATTSFESMLVLILIDVWEWTPLIMLMVYAGLNTIPQDPYESALIDGANKWQTFTQITLPLASSSILVAILMRLIDVVKTFDIIYATTQGGPNFATENINIYAYNAG